MGKKKVAILINSMNAGGAERVVSEICNNLNNEFDIFLVLLYDKIYYNLSENIQIIKLNQNEKTNEVLRIFKMPFVAFNYYTFCKKNKIETSFSLLSKANFINCFSAIFNPKYKIIISERTNESDYLLQLSKLKAFTQKQLVKCLFPLADVVTANSKHALIDLKEVFKINKPQKVIYNPINTELIIQKSKEYTAKPVLGDLKIICIANFRPEKNHSMIIEACKLVENLNIIITLIGSGDYSKITEYIAKNNLTEKFNVLGFKSNPFPELINADLLLLTSDFEGLPNVVLEALCCNIPVISTATLGSIELLNENAFADYSKPVFGKYGILTPIKNATLLAEVITKVYNNKEILNTFKIESKNKIDQFKLYKTLEKVKELF